jgi:cobalt-zinc-cadmium efflux system outer membrane protein
VTPAEKIDGNISLPDNLETLTNTALQLNPHYLLQQTQIVFQQQNVVYQKALRSPDITLGPNFDRNSNFAPNYIGMGISLPIPVLNKNQGNIKSAEFNVKQQQAVTQGTETELRNNVSNAYRKLMLTIEQNNATQKDFYAKYQAIYDNMFQSYQQRQISLLEFLDFFNDFTDSQQRLLQQYLNLHLAQEELQFNVGK